MICTGNSTTQVKALADNVVETLKEEYGADGAVKTGGLQNLSVDSDRLRQRGYPCI